MEKIKSGIFGLNEILDGGINKNSTTVVIGCSGAGKTTFATQFIRRGLEMGQDGIFVSLDENKEQIIREAVEMGWPEILDYIEDDRLVFIDASGKEFSTFIKEELPTFVADWEGADARIAIDPLTPVMWSTDDRYYQRDLIGFMLKETRKVGTVVCTLEEHGSLGDLSGNETIIPMYLADSVIHLRFRNFQDGTRQRELKIMKCRSSRHSERTHHYQIVKGLGMIVEHGSHEVTPTRKVPMELREGLIGKGVLPKYVEARMHKVLNDLHDADFGSIPSSQIMKDIIKEYSDE